ncbi:MAG TPA: enoyl-CoA hydratase/isomerase family protein, partial [Acidobacteriota bacterium]|nr:enoyl-CoA hydratase/isomerase family protein [Acidobacteriota bacterium]
MAYENILVDIQGPVGIVVLNRPQSLNAIDKATIVELLGAFETLRDTDAVRAIVFTGAGRAFSSGGDIKEMIRSQGATSDEVFREHIGDINRTISLMGEIPKPVI